MGREGLLWCHVGGLGGASVNSINTPSPFLASGDPARGGPDCGQLRLVLHRPAAAIHSLRGFQGRAIYQYDSTFQGRAISR